MDETEAAMKETRAQVERDHPAEMKDAIALDDVAEMTRQSGALCSNRVANRFAGPERAEEPL